MKSFISNLLLAIGFGLAALGYFLPIFGSWDVYTVFSFYEAMNVFDIILSLLGVCIEIFGILLIFIPALKNLKHSNLLKFLCLYVGLIITLSLNVILGTYGLIVAPLTASLPFWFSLIGYITAFVGFYWENVSSFFVKFWNDTTAKFDKAN